MISFTPGLPEYFDRKRRKDGLLLGLLAGFLFGSISNGVNYLVVSGVTFYQPPFGPVGNTTLWVVIGGLLGLIACWSGGGALGISIGCLFAGLLMQASIFLSGDLRINLVAKLLAMAGFYLPFAAMAAPLLWLVRATANDQREWYDKPFFSWQRLRMPLLLVLVFGGIGMFWLLPADGQVETTQIDRMIRSSLASDNQPILPEPFKDPLVGDFTQKATSSYTLEFVRENLTRFMIPYVPQAQSQPAVVIARFSSGWTLACLYINPTVDPFCRGYDDLEGETGIGANSPDIFSDHGFYVPNPDVSHQPTPVP